MGRHGNGAPDAGAAADDLLYNAVDGAVCRGAVFGGNLVVGRSDIRAAGCLVEAVTGGAIASCDELERFVISGVGSGGCGGGCSCRVGSGCRFFLAGAATGAEKEGQ